MPKHGIGSSLQKDTLDQYYTDPTYALYFWKQIDKLLNLDGYDLFVEPCAGTGSFYDLMPKDKRIGIDIHPQCDDTIETDFLTWPGPPVPSGRVLTITNPPFGQNSNLAIRFFNRAGLYSSAIGIVAPKSFKKSTIQKRLDNSFELIWEQDTPKKSFINNQNINVDVKTVAQVWKRKHLFSRKDVEHNYMHLFKFVTFDDDYDLILRRIGYNSGKFYSKVEEQEKNQFYFIKTFSNEVYNNILKIDFSECRDNTGGGLSVNRKDVVNEYFKLQEKTDDRNNK